MKKQLLTIFAAMTVFSGISQVASPSWSTSQNAGFTPLNYQVEYLDAVDANVVWAAAIDGQFPSRNWNWVSRTINGGTTWNVSNAYPDTNTYIMANMEGIDANTAWVCAYSKSVSAQGAIHNTSNGGTSWSNMTPAGMFTNTAAFGDFITFLTPSVGIVVGDPAPSAFEIWRTTDGGTTWTIVPGSSIATPLAGEYAIVDLYCKLGPNNAWFGTQRGRVYRTTNQGLTWQASAVAAITFTVIELEFASATNGLVLGVNNTGGGNVLELYNTTDGGVTWSQITTIDPNMGRADFCRIPGTTYYAGADEGNNLISYSKDNGVTWTTWGGTGLPYRRIDFADQNYGWSGAYSNFPTGTLTVGGIWKYKAATFNSSFTVPQYVCKPIGNATISPVNTSTGISTPMNYSWTCSSNAVSFSSNTTTVPVITFTANGTYTINLAATNAEGTGNSSQVVTVLTCAQPQAGLNVPTNTICNNVAMTVTNTSIGAPAPTVTITTNPSTNVTITPGSGSLYSIKYGNPGTYTITLNASNAAGTSSSTSVVNITNCNPAPNFNIPPVFYRCTNIDRMQTVNTSSSPITAPTSYSWSCSPAAGVTFSTSSTNSAPSIAFNSSVTTAYTITLRASNTSGTVTTTQTVAIDLCTGLNESKTSEVRFELFPNPTKDVLTVKFSNSDINQIKVSNVLGSVVYDETISGKESAIINLSNKPKGVYFVTVVSNNIKTTKKIIVE